MIKFMPLINVYTSTTTAYDPQELLKSLSQHLSTLTGKPERYVMTKLHTDLVMTFGGTNDPCCYVEVKSIGAIDSQSMSATFCKLIETKTGIPSNRIYIAFEDVPPNRWGWDGRTFG